MRTRGRASTVRWPRVEDEIERRLTDGGRDGWPLWERHVPRAAGCARPVRLRGQAVTVNTTTGEVGDTYRSADAPQGLIYKSCGTRRASVCPSCARTYQYDAYHLLKAGLAGSRSAGVARGRRAAPRRPADPDRAELRPRPLPPRQGRQADALPSSPRQAALPPWSAPLVQATAPALRRRHREAAVSRLLRPRRARGARTEELRALLWSDVDLLGRPDVTPPVPPEMAVWRSVRISGDTKTRRSRRTLALPARCVDVLPGHRRMQTRMQTRTRAEASEKWIDLGLVFPTRYGTPLDAADVRRDFRAAIGRGAHCREWTPDDWTPFAPVRQRRPHRGDLPPRRPPQHRGHGDRLPQAAAPGHPVRRDGHGSPVRGQQARAWRAVWRAGAPGTREPGSLAAGAGLWLRGSVGLRGLEPLTSSLSATPGGEPHLR